MIPTTSPTPAHEMEWDAIARAVFAALGIRRGLWRLGVKLHFAGMTSGWQSPEGETAQQLPTAVTAINGLLLWAVDAPGPMVFDASAAPSPQPVAKAPRRRIKPPRTER